MQLAAEDHQYYKILWRGNKSLPILTYVLNTVTYGTASTQYLAIKTLHQLAEDEKIYFPRVAATLKLDFYVDDLLTGADTFDEAVKIRDELVNIIRKGEFELRQWFSTDSRLLESYIQQTDDKLFKILPGEWKKTLGLFWNRVHDTLG
ncbi:uncharacterized protein LOC143174272 [Nomia melanderi]|uniref:uncharacterized protein LOC143174272 n=1 Tax=Nomia melanderi TaxID=2448451 RepID=UPI003FCD9597